MNDAMSGKTFEEIGKTVATYRVQEYLLKRSQYCSIIANFQTNNTIHTISAEDFGSIDDPVKYNQKLQRSDKFTIDCFNKTVKDNIAIINEINDCHYFSNSA